MTGTPTQPSDSTASPPTNSNQLRVLVASLIDVLKGHETTTLVVLEGAVDTTILLPRNIADRLLEDRERA